MEMAITFENRYTPVAGEDELRLSDYLAVVLANWRLILAITALALALGSAYAFLAPAVYRADALIQVEDSSGNNNNKDLVQTMSQLFDAKSSTSAEIELVRSRLMVEDTVRKLHLDISAHPRGLPVVGALLPYWLSAAANVPSLHRMASPLEAFCVGDERIAVSRFDTPRGAYGKTYTLTARANQTYLLSDPNGQPVLQGQVGRSESGASALGPVQLQVDSLSGAPGKQFQLERASTLETVDALQRKLTVAEVTLQSGIIGVSLEGHDSALTAAVVNSIAQRFVAQDVDKKSAEAEHTLAFLDQQLPQLRKQLDQAEQAYNSFRFRQGTVDLGEESRLLLQQIVDNKSKLIDLQQRRAELSQRFTAAHPAVVALDAQIGALSGTQAALNHNVASLPETEQNALRLLRDVRVDTELYMNVLNSAQQLRIVKAGQVGNVRVVDFAEAADEPVRPKRVIAILASGAVGLFIGILAAFVRKALYGGVEFPEQIERAFSVPVFAIVPRSNQQRRLQQQVAYRRDGLHVLAAQAPQDAAVEGIRSLRTSLRFTLAGAKNNIVMLTGSRADAGKSFLSVNLAALVASANQRVLLIDGDMRRGDIHSHFGIKYSPGLSDLLMQGEGGDERFERTVVHGVLPGLDVLTRGSLPGNPAELLMSERLEALLDQLARRYDLIIIDTPPVLAVTDAALIGRHAGTTLLVVRHGRHQVQEIAETVKRLDNGGVTLKGVLLTDVPQSKLLPRAAYGGYYTYESYESIAQ
jgi:tyrosine-protein kinase Etk/Wzc